MNIEKITEFVTDNPLLIVGGSLVVVVLVSVLFLAWVVGLHNNEVVLRNQIDAKIQERNATFDNTWKIISQKAQVSDKYKGDFKDTFVAIMDSRNQGNKGQLANFLVEANPNFDSKLYQEVSNSIEVQRNIFNRTQKELLDINREHLNLISKFPANVYFSIVGTQPINITIITSSKTEQTVESGREDDIKIY